MYKENLLNNKGKMNEDVLFDDNKLNYSKKFDSTDLFQILLKRLYHEKNYNKAEDLIFNELSLNPTREKYEIALDFYNSLIQKNDFELKSSNFSMEEVYQGLNDLKKYENI